ncbi:hypothetical protein KDU71_14945 [Carboxylicivirga sediminis]|uniref:Uncharacterized protein n=1 Tax=Carboxylicivirga sediminis TaxID=2006564 RepID=A0A941F7T3_9BACT|nr:hypothetical protein [Carboxylicivirga sediminis]MBR8536870.1 hypothetical protein [Carboxylicivirga sediminis]
MKYKLKLPQPLTIEELKYKVENGYRFKAFQYCFSPIFATYYPFSPAFLLKDGETGKPQIRKYNMISAIFGWWGVPYGPLYTIRSMRFNLKGGLDVTDDILKNITEEDLSNNCVHLIETTLLYKQPAKSDIKTMNKLVRDYSYDYNLKECYAAWALEYSNVFCVGLKADTNFDKYAAAFQAHLHKKFYKHIQIDIIDMSAEEEAVDLLRKQGTQVIGR